MKKLNTGYKRDKKQKVKKQRNTYLQNLVMYKKGAKVSLMERVVKILIYIALRLVIRPRKWKHPEKNYEIIDRTYKRIMSADFIFIPSSIAFYIIMAFMPVLTLIVLFLSIPAVNNFTSNELEQILGKFLPGSTEVLNQLKSASGSWSGGSLFHNVGGILATLVSLVISTWIASGGFAKLIYTQSYIYEHKFVGGYWMNRIKGMFMVLALTGFLILALIINVGVNKLINTSDMTDLGKESVRYLFLWFGLLFLVFSGMIALYRFSPRFKIKIRHVIPGAMVTALPTTIFLSLFGYISSRWSYGNYGFIGVIMYVGMSALIVSNFLFMGMISNASYYKTFVSKTMEKKWTVSKK